MTARLQRGPQGVGIFDDAVVHEGDVAGTVDVGMGVGGRRRAMCGPAGVRDPGRAGQGFAIEVITQALDPPRELANDERTAVSPVSTVARDSPVSAVSPMAVHHGHARGVVAAILEPAQPLQQNGSGVTRAHVPDDSTHARPSLQRDRTASGSGRQDRRDRSGRAASSSRAGGVPAPRARAACRIADRARPGARAAPFPGLHHNVGTSWLRVRPDTSSGPPRGTLARRARERPTPQRRYSL